MSVSIKCLKAEHGDAFIITVAQGDELHYIVVDGGPSSKFCIEEVVDELKAIPFVDLMILTHFDDDHIAGLLAYLEAYKDTTLPVKEIWANCSKVIRVHTSSDISYSQANTDVRGNDIKETEIKRDSDLSPQFLEFLVLEDKVLLI